jgi:hypothetical protein
MKKLIFTVVSLITTLTIINFTIGITSGGATPNSVSDTEASFDGVVFIGDTMEEVKKKVPNLETTYLEGWALVNDRNAYIFNDDGILVLIAKKINDDNWTWIKEQGFKYDDVGYFLGETRYEVIKGDLLYTYYDNEDEDIVTLEKVAEKEE